jgi:hypothetical protein
MKPFRFTRSYSEARVRRRPFGNENEPAGCILRDCTAEVFPKRFSGEDFAKKNAAELTNRAVSQLAIPLLQQETQLFQRLQRRNRLLTPDGWPLAVDSSKVESSSVRLSQSFAHTPQAVQRWPGCRYIFS